MLSGNQACAPLIPWRPSTTARATQKPRLRYSGV